MTKRFFSRSIGLFLTLIMLMATSFSSLAAENTDEDFNHLLYGNISREEALEFLGISPEDADKVTVYMVEEDVLSPSGRLTEITDQSRTYINAGEALVCNPFTFTGTNTGRYRTMKGNQLCYGVIYELPWQSGAGSQLNVSLHAYNGYGAVHSESFTNLGSTTGSYQSPWIGITKGLDYNFKYWCREHIADPAAPQKATVRMIVAVM